MEGLNPGGNRRGAAGPGRKGAQGQAHPEREQNGRDSRFAGTQTVPGFGPHARTVKVRKGISFPCSPAALTISHWRAQQRPPTALRVAEPTPGTPKPIPTPLNPRPTTEALCLDRDAGAALASHSGDGRSFIDVSTATTSPPPFSFECSNHQ